MAPAAGSRPLRIAMTSYYLPGSSKIGAGYQAHGLANALVEQGNSVTMFSPTGAQEGARYAHVSSVLEGPNRTIKWAREIAKADLSEFDVLHSHGDDYLRIGRRPVHVRTMHGSCFAEAVHIRGARERTRMVALGVTEVAAAAVADATVAVSENTRRWYPWIRRVIPNGVDLDRFAPSGPRESMPTVLFVGTYGRRKRGRLLMEQFRTVVRPAIPDAQLWMVCDDAPAEPGVEVLGRLTDDELADRYRRAWVFCLPSSYEGFGVPYIEAMASGTPVVATPNVGAREVLAGGEYGVISDADDLGSSIVRLLRSDAERATLADRGRRRAAIYAWPVVAGAYRELYAELLARRAA